MATIGRGAAVAQIGGLRISGWFAWVMWLFVHQMYIVAFSNRFLVMLQWGWSYFTFGRSARLITGADIEYAAPQQSCQTGKTSSVVNFENRNAASSGMEEPS